MSQFSISYQELVTELLRFGRNIDCLQSYLRKSFPNLVESNIEKVLQDINKRFLPQLNVRWNKVQRSKKKFYDKYSGWLENNFRVEFEVHNFNFARPLKSVGRPRKNFDECCDRAKRYKKNELRSAYPEELIKAAAINIQEKNEKNGFDADAALALMMDAQLSKRQYETIRAAIKKIGFNIFPSYKKILK